MRKNKNFKKERKRRRAKRWIERKLDMMMEIPQTARDQRSFTAEEIALRAAQYWQKKKVIKKARRTTHFSPEDLAKKDIVIEHLNGREMAIDIKTFWDAEKETECRGKNVYLLPIRPGQEEELIREKMLGLIIVDLVHNLEPREIRKLVLNIEEKQPKRKRKGLAKFFTKLKKLFSGKILGRV